MKISTSLRFSLAFCLPISIASPSAQADQSASAAAERYEAGSATLADVEVKCAAGLLPLVMKGDLTGTLEVPFGKVSFLGGQGLLGYCGYPVPRGGVSLVDVRKRWDGGKLRSSITGRNGLILSCANHELPLILKGRAEGQLRTGKGIVILHGNDNDVAVCLTPAKTR